MKVKISKENWIKATTDIKGKFWCPIERQESLLNVWPDGVDIEIEVDKQEDNKECRCERCGKKYSVPITYKYASCICKDCIIQISPSPLDDICEIKRFILVTDGSDVVLYPEMKDMAIKLNEVIKTVNLIIKQLKQK